MYSFVVRANGTAIIQRTVPNYIKGIELRAELRKKFGRDLVRVSHSREPFIFAIKGLSALALENGKTTGDPVEPMRIKVPPEDQKLPPEKGDTASGDVIDRHSGFLATQLKTWQGVEAV